MFWCMPCSSFGKVCQIFGRALSWLLRWLFTVWIVSWVFGHLFVFLDYIIWPSLTMSSKTGGRWWKSSWRKLDNSCLISMSWVLQKLSTKSCTSKRSFLTKETLMLARISIRESLFRLKIYQMMKKMLGLRFRCWMVVMEEVSIPYKCGLSLWSIFFLHSFSVFFLSILFRWNLFCWNLFLYMSTISFGSWF